MDDEKWRTDTAERPAVSGPRPPARPDAPAPLPPRPPADRPGQPPRAQPAPRLDRLGRSSASSSSRRRGRSPARAPAAGDQHGRRPDRDHGTSSRPTRTSPPPSEPSQRRRPSAVGRRAVRRRAQRRGARPGVDAAGRHGRSVTVPAAAPPNNDVTGELVTFDGTNMLDGRTRRAGGWPATRRAHHHLHLRPAGHDHLDRHPQRLREDLDRRERTGVRLVRRQPAPAQRRVGGRRPGGAGRTSRDSTQVQYIDIEPTETTTVELRLIAVSPPGTGPTSRDYTAISEVAFNGYPS